MSAYRSSQRAGGGIAFKLVAWTAALALVALPLIGVVNGWFASSRWPFRQIRIDAEFTHVNAEQIRAAAMPHLAVGFFAVNLAEVRQAIEQLPWVEHAEVRKRWPDLIEVHAIERVAVAVWSDHRLVSAKGDLFAVPGNSGMDGLPQLAGPDARVAEVLAFFDDARTQLSGTGLQASAVSLSGRGSWTLDLLSGARIVVGREQARERLQRFIAALPRLEPAAGAQLQRVDLRYANGFAIQWQTLAPMEPELPPVTAPAPESGTTEPSTEA